MGDRWYTQAFGAHYPLLYRHRDAAEAERCLDLLPRLAPLTWAPGQAILDLGCGDGRHLEILAGQGRRAVGLDLSDPLLRSAQVRIFGEDPPALVRGDMRRLPFRPGSFSAVLSLFTAFGYFESPAANREPVQEVTRVLLPGGHWFLDYFDADRVRAELSIEASSVRVRELGPLSIREERGLGLGNACVTKQVRLEPLPGNKEQAAVWGIPSAGLEYTESVALFTLEELDAMAAAHSLKRVAAAGGYAGEPLGSGSRWILVFRKSSKDDIV